jgi:nicotinamidase-related amidase/predicted MFS family arabinose efflux permease
VTSRSPGDFDRKLIAPMILGSILNPVNSSMIAVALIPIGVAFGASPSATAWLVSALYLATATGQPVVGRLVDMYGPRRLFLAGATLVGIAGVLGALAPNLGGLIVARVLLGFGTCAGYPAAMYLIRSEARRTGHDSPGSVLTALAVSSQTVAVLGPPLGGLLIGVGGWRTIFAVNIPLALASLVLGALRLPRSSGSGGSLRGADLPGIALFAATLTTLLLLLMDPRLDRWWLLVLTVVAAAGFAVRELRVDEPFIDLRVFGGNIPLLTTYVRTLLAYTVSYAFLYGYTQWLEAGRGLSASQAGLVLLPVFLGGIVVASLTGRRPEVRAKLVVGGICQIAGCGLLLVLHPASAIALLVAVALILGIPQGLISLANQNAVYYQADPTRMGASAGLLRTFMYLGAIVASAATGVFFKHGAGTPGLHDLAVFMLVVGVLFLALTIVDRSLGRVGPAPQSSGEDNPVALTTLDPNTALVVIDLQQGIVAAPTVPHAGADVVSRAVDLATAFRAHGAPVVLVRVTAAPDGSDAAPGRTEAGSRGVRPEGWDTIVEDLTTDPNDIIVTKRNWGAFFGTDLDLQLRRRGVTQLVLAGIATSVGVESTARAAHEHGYHVTLATDAMADLDEDAHRHSIEKIFPRLGETGTTAEIIDLLDKTRA